MHPSSVRIAQKFYLLHVKFRNAQLWQERSQFFWECGGGGTQSLRSHAMCPPYCNECISLLKLWLVSVLRRRKGGWGWRGVFFRGDGERLVVKNSVLKSHLSCQRADTGHPGMRGLWCSESGHWPSFPPLLPPTTPPPPTPPTTPHLQNTPHLICSSLSPWPQWTALLLTPPLCPLSFTLSCLLCWDHFSKRALWKLKYHKSVK